MKKKKLKIEQSVWKERKAGKQGDNRANMEGEKDGKSEFYFTKEKFVLKKFKKQK